GQLDLLVVTHQHKDHVSGFNQARAIFDKISAKEVWMSWIEDSSDEIGRILKEKYGKKLKHLKAAAQRAEKELKTESNKKYKVRGFGQRLSAKANSMADTIKLIEFEEGLNLGKGLASGKRTNDDAMEYVRNKTTNIHYRKPGDVVQIPGAEGIKFFILGPPRDADMKFFKIATKEEEMYHLAANTEKEETQIKPDNAILTAGILLEDLVSPFNAQYRLNKDQKNEFMKAYNSKDVRWRQIETDWLESSASLALRVTSLTNNTSLAMAIEFTASEKVMLLPADAQSGNWMSWHKPDVMKDLKLKGGKDTVELLKNTVFYKVGHHGSHNGTASLSGLDLINSADLVAMMPLVQDKVPKEWGGADNFPAKALYNVLIDKTKGRIIRTDEGIVKSARAKKLRDLLSTADLKRFNASFDDGPCYKEFTLKV
ncbi:MAG TPA: hypothetical protein VK666_21805, partial [Chryseolinea sp.]|nr:hypothetical protein [Chryseolinea sp.]